MAIPPRCKICKKDIRSHGDHFRIGFKKTEKTEEIESKNKREPGWVGPYYTDRSAYFCKDHKDIEKYDHLTMQEAIEQYKKTNILDKVRKFFKKV